MTNTHTHTTGTLREVMFLRLLNVHGSSTHYWGQSIQGMSQRCSVGTNAIAHFPLPPGYLVQLWPLEQFHRWMVASVLSRVLHSRPGEQCGLTPELLIVRPLSVQDHSARVCISRWVIHYWGGTEECVTIGALIVQWLQGCFAFKIAPHPFAP